MTEEAWWSGLRHISADDIEARLREQGILCSDLIVALEGCGDRCSQCDQPSLLYVATIRYAGGWWIRDAISILAHALTGSHGADLPLIARWQAQVDAIEAYDPIVLPCMLARELEQDARPPQRT